MPRIRHRIEATVWPTEPQAAAAKLFSPLHVGPTELKQRTWVPAMVPWRATDEGFVTEAVLDWYGRFALGRPGVIVVEATGIADVPSGPLLRIGHSRYLEGLRRLTERVHNDSGGQTKVFIQLIDFLAIKRRPPPEKFFARFMVVDAGLRAALQALSPEQDWLSAPDSEVRTQVEGLDDTQRSEVLTVRQLDELNQGYRERVTDTHLEHIRDLPNVLPDRFAQAALRAEQAGFDGVELHFAHAYTMASFFSRLNTRTDGYGGDLAGRARLGLEVTRAVQDRLSPSTVLGCRLLADEVIPGGSRVQDAAYFAGELAKAGLHFISLSKGGKFEDAKRPRIGHAAYPYTGPSGLECMPTIYSDVRGPVGRHLPLARAVRTHLRDLGQQIPVVAAGALNTFEVAEGALQDGDCDIVASARQTLADPDWWLKMRQGHGAAIRRCALTNYCEGLDQAHKEVTCRLWDRTFDEDSIAAPRTKCGKRRLTAPPWVRLPEQ